MINFLLQSDISCFPKIYTRFDYDHNDNVVKCESPILKLYNEIFEKNNEIFENNFKLLLIGTSGQGKTTVMSILQAELIYRKVPYYYYEGKEINDEKLQQIKELNSEYIIIVDAWDEILLPPESKNNFKRILESKQRVIVTSRRKDDFENVEYIVAEMLPFSTREIFELIGDVDIDEKSRFFDLISNTMYLVSYLNEENRKRRKQLRNAQNSADFIFQNLKNLIDGKGNYAEINNYYAFFEKIGEYIAKGICVEDCSDGINIDSSLNTIAEQYLDEKENYRIKTSHFRYEVFFLATYLKQLIKDFVSSDSSLKKDSLKEILCDIPFFEQSNYIEALVMTGELLKIDVNFKEKQINKLKEITSETSLRDVAGDYWACRFVLIVLYILLGYNDLCFDDVFFNVTNTDMYKYLKCFSFIGGNAYLRSLKIHKSIPQGRFFDNLPNLRSIEVDFDHPNLFSKNNCIIQKGKNILLMGCRQSLIPNGVTKIEDYAFYSCIGIKEIDIPESVTEIGNESFAWCLDLEKIHIPNSVKKIGYKAFRNCLKLQELILPESLTEIGEGVIGGCHSLKKLVISQNIKEITSGTFDMFEGLYSVSLAPTLIYQFDGYDEYNKEYIEEDEYKKECVNELEQINSTGENGAFICNWNCLNDVMAKKILLGCKNSKISKEMTTIGHHAFAGVTFDNDLVNIPQNVETIEKYAFASTKFKYGELPKKLRTLGEGVFRYSNFIGLEFKSLPKNFTENNLREMFQKACFVRIIIPHGIMSYNGVGLCWNAYLGYWSGEIYERDVDGTLIPPKYSADVKRQALILLKKETGSCFGAQNGIDCQKLFNVVMKELQSNAFDGLCQDRYKHIINQKARAFLGKILRHMIEVTGQYQIEENIVKAINEELL